MTENNLFENEQNWILSINYSKSKKKFMIILRVNKGKLNEENFFSNHAVGLLPSFVNKCTFINYLNNISV